MKRAAVLILAVSFGAFAQTGGSYAVENSLIASGGGANSGGNFSLESTAGQTLAGGNLLGGSFLVQNGFWTFSLTPTAATVTIGGRVGTFDGQGIQNARVLLTAPDSTTQIAATGSFGAYRFNVPAGGTYILTVFSSRFFFAEPTRVVNVAKEFGTLDFTAEPQ